MAKNTESVLTQTNKDVGKILLRVDNQAAISLTRPWSSSSWRTRHLRIRASYIHEQVECEQAAVAFAPGKHQWADLLTRSFPRQRQEELIGIWGFIDVAREVSKVAMARMIVQTTRAKEPPALTLSFELYVMVVVLGIAIVAAWEFLWWCVDRSCGEVRPSRSAKRLRNL